VLVRWLQFWVASIPHAFGAINSSVNPTLTWRTRGGVVQATFYHFTAVTCLRSSRIWEGSLWLPIWEDLCVYWEEDSSPWLWSRWWCSSLRIELGALKVEQESLASIETKSSEIPLRHLPSRNGVCASQSLLVTPTCDTYRGREFSRVCLTD